MIFDQLILFYSLQKTNFGEMWFRLEVGSKVENDGIKQQLN